MKSIRTIFVLTLSLVSQFLAANSVKSVDINVKLAVDGTASIIETWDVIAESGTEMYLVRENLEDIEIRNLGVTDESGVTYKYEQPWELGRNLAGKAARCGIAHKNNGGCEICWGLGSYGHHTYVVSYDMTNAVKSLQDCDILHLQLLSPEINASIDRVNVDISIPENNDVRTPVKGWGFGFDGQLEVRQDGVSLWSESTWTPESSVIVLLRFEKGIFQSSSVRNKTFEEVRQTAFSGSDYNDEDSGEDSLMDLVAAVFAGLASIMAVSVIMARRRKKKVFGTARLSDIGWCRNVPFDGDILMSDYVLDKSESMRKSNTVASAIILRMLQRGNLSTGADHKGRLEISFNDNASFEWMSDLEKELYNMMRTASGSDNILQNREFSRWSVTHAETVSKWAQNVKTQSGARLNLAGYMNGMGKFSDEGQKKAREVIGFRKFLSDFTLSSERKSAEVHLWKDYLVFAALYGIANEVAKELKDIDPKILSEALPCYNPYMYSDLLRMSGRLADSITSATLSAKAEAMRASGMGGHTSFGGGGGFSGGGSGGGFR